MKYPLTRYVPSLLPLLLNKEWSAFPHFHMYIKETGGGRKKNQNLSSFAYILKNSSMKLYFCKTIYLSFIAWEWILFSKGSEHLPYRFGPLLPQLCSTQNTCLCLKILVPRIKSFICRLKKKCTLKCNRTEDWCCITECLILKDVKYCVCFTETCFQSTWQALSLFSFLTDFLLKLNFLKEYCLDYLKTVT